MKRNEVIGARKRSARLEILGEVGFLGDITKALPFAGLEVNGHTDLDSALPTLRRQPRPDLVIAPINHQGIELNRTAQRYHPEIPIFLVGRNARCSELPQAAHLAGAMVIVGERWEHDLWQEAKRILPLEQAEAGEPNSELPDQLTQLQQRLQHRFTVEAFIGAGGFGRVYLILDRRENTYKAVKVLPDDSRERLGTLRGMSLSHPGIIEVELFEHWLERNLILCVMPIADDLHGGQLIFANDYRPCTLENYLKSNSGRLRAAALRKILRPLSSALAYLHAREIVHRDIKPANILKVRNNWMFSDIGLLAQFDSNTRIVSEGYTPPEGTGKPTADIYSFGRVLGYVLRSLASGPEEALLKTKLAAIMAKATQASPADRYQSADDLGTALDQAGLRQL